MFEAFINCDGVWSVHEGDHLLKSGFKTADEALEWANNKYWESNSLKNNLNLL